MRIGIIARGLTKGGVARYVKNILTVFNDSQRESCKFTLFTDEEEFINVYTNIDVIYIKKSNKIFWDYIKVIPYLRKHKVDVLLYPKNIIPFTHLVFGFKKINIVYDLAYFDTQLNEYKFFDTVYIRCFLRLSCKIADVVITLSEATKRDVHDRLGTPLDKVHVVPTGVESYFVKNKDSGTIEATLSKYAMRTPFLFYCGSLSPRKNVLRTLQAFEHIKDQIPHNLYITGGQSWNDAAVLTYIQTFLSDRVFIIGYVSESELVNLYSSAALYLYPSLYEGFGLPILEAQSCECPVLTSNKTSCPEVAGKGAHICDPFSIESILGGMLKILTDQAYRTDLIKEGLINVKRFDLQETTQELLERILSVK